MSISLTLRSVKGEPLTYEEVDANFAALHRALCPDGFSFTAQTDAPLGAVVESSAVTLEGDSGAVWPLVVRGDGSPQIQVAGGAWGTDGVARAGDSLKVRLTSSGSPLTARAATVYAPGRSAAFSVTTADVFDLANVSGLRYWLDASDFGTLTLSTSNVTAWANKGSVTTTTAQANPAIAPNYDSTGLAGEPTVDWTGTTDVLETSANLATLVGDTDDYAIFAVGRADTVSTNATDGYTNAALLGDKGGYCSIYFRSTGVVGAYVWDGANRTAERSYTLGTNAIFHHQHSGGSVRCRVNGGDEAATAAGAIQVATAVVSIGQQSSNAAYTLDGAISEVVIVSPAPDATVRQQIEGYLAHKWGLTANLPGSHPYKTTPP